MQKRNPLYNHTSHFNTFLFCPAKEWTHMKICHSAFIEVNPLKQRAQIEVKIQQPHWTESYLHSGYKVILLTVSSQSIVTHFRVQSKILPKTVVFYRRIVCGGKVRCTFRGGGALLLTWPTVWQGVIVLWGRVLIVVLLWAEAMIAGLPSGGRVVAWGGGGKGVLRRVAVGIHGVAECQWLQWRARGLKERRTSGLL